MKAVLRVNHCNLMLESNWMIQGLQEKVKKKRTRFVILLPVYVLCC